MCILTTYITFVLLLANHPFPQPLNSSHLVLIFSPAVIIISVSFQGLASSLHFFFLPSLLVFKSLVKYDELESPLAGVIVVCLWFCNTSCASVEHQPQICVAVLSLLPHWAALRKGTLSMINAFFLILFGDWLNNLYSIDFQMFKSHL